MDDQTDMTAATAPENELARAAKVGLGTVLLLGALTTLGPISIDMYLPALPTIAADLHATAAQTEQTVALFFIGLAVGQLAYGPLSDRYGRRSPLLVSLALYIAGGIACTLAPTIGTLFAGRVLQALGACGGMVIVRAVVRDRFHSSEMLHIFSLLMLVLAVSPLMAPLLGSWLLLIGSWRVIFAVQVVAGIATAIAVIFRLPESRSEETAHNARNENPVQSYLVLLTNRRLLAYLLGGAFSGAALFTYIASAPDVVIDHYHLSPQFFGWVFSINGAGIIGAMQINARMGRRWPGDLIVRVALRVTIGFSLAMIAVAFTGFGGVWALLATLFGVIASLGFSQANTGAEAMKIDPRRAGATSALTGAASFGAGSACAGFTSLINDGTARPMSLVIAASLVIGLASLELLAPRRRT